MAHDPEREFVAFSSESKKDAEAFARDERDRSHQLPVRVQPSDDGRSYEVIVTHKAAPKPDAG